MPAIRMLLGLCQGLCWVTAVVLSNDVRVVLLILTTIVLSYVHDGVCQADVRQLEKRLRKEIDRDTAK